MQTTLGGDRLGSGNKQNLSFRNYERSSHDIGYLWRSTMSSGTLVPFLSKLALPGDKWEIDLNAEVMTLPTIGPLFGSYKVQLDVFEVPMRLYNAKLHMNKLGVGMDMKQIYLPQIEVNAKNEPTVPRTYAENEQINASSLLKYLGIGGIGHPTGNVSPAKRDFNAVPVLAYWDIYKNYYSNKQQETGVFIHTDSGAISGAMIPNGAQLYSKIGASKGSVLYPAQVVAVTDDYCIIQYGEQALEPNPATIKLDVDGVEMLVTGVFASSEWYDSTKQLRCNNFLVANTGSSFGVKMLAAVPKADETQIFGTVEFPLANIDLMREQILQYSGGSAFRITSESITPYGPPLTWWGTSPNTKFSQTFSQEGLGIKTYQSDLFNNWVNTEWIDGTGGISELTAVDTTSGEFTIDALNIASKVYDMLNRIAVSGGTYDDWLEAVYTHERVRGVESPVYCGGLIKELSFEEVIALANSSLEGSEQPLGTLAGRGRLTGKNKGGKVEISVNEPSYIIGIVSLTPRIDYSQGIEWDMNLKTFDDFHKPALDGIGFQDLMTEQMVWSDTGVADNGTLTKSALGKQPAWINYMSAVNKNFGGFAEENNSMFMVLNRRYEKNADGTIQDATTYIDPRKFNHIFAQTSLDAQNFWVQIACNITARRKMSAKIIPNL
ncbi:MAG: major capsid protein [Microviridae sp.]|nr:MAG: major capsid protein [Microviridae sp.]